MFYARIDPRTGEVMYMGMDGVPAPDQRAAQRAVAAASGFADSAAPTGNGDADGRDDGGDDELAHIKNVAALRQYTWMQDPLVTAVLEAVRERGELSVSRTIVGRCLQYARMLEARGEALRLSRQALDTAKDYAEAARQLGVLVRYELTEDA